MMNTFIITLFVTLCTISFGQDFKKTWKTLNLKNALVIAQMPEEEEQYSLEVTLTNMLNSNNIKALPSLNLLKQWGTASTLASDSLKNIIAQKGIDTYLIVSVQGYDRKYKVSNPSDDYVTALGQGAFFDLYQQDIVSVSFQFKFFRDGKCIHAEIVKCGNAGSRKSVLNHFQKKVGKRIRKNWK